MRVRAMQREKLLADPHAIVGIMKTFNARGKARNKGAYDVRGGVFAQIIEKHNLVDQVDHGEHRGQQEFLAVSYPDHGGNRFATPPPLGGQGFAMRAEARLAKTPAQMMCSPP
jgi:hypothetical protein